MENHQLGRNANNWQRANQQRYGWWPRVKRFVRNLHRRFERWEEEYGMWFLLPVLLLLVPAAIIALQFFFLLG